MTFCNHTGLPLIQRNPVLFQYIKVILENPQNSVSPANPVHVTQLREELIYLKIPLPQYLICNWDLTSQYSKNLQVQRGSENELSVQVLVTFKREDYYVYAKGSIALDTYSLCIDVKDQEASLEVGCLILPYSQYVPTPSVALVAISLKGTGKTILRVMCNRESKVIEAQYNGLTVVSNISDVLLQCDNFSHSPQLNRSISPPLSEPLKLKSPATSPSALDYMSPPRPYLDSLKLSECPNKIAVLDSLNNTSILFPFVKCLSRNATVSIINGHN